SPSAAARQPCRGGTRAGRITLRAARDALRCEAPWIAAHSGWNMPPVLPFTPDASEKLRPARCYVDQDWTTSRLTGWMLLPDQEIESVRVYVNGVRAGAAALEPHPPTAQRYKHIPHSGRSGFRMEVRPSLFQRDRINPVTVIGCQGDRPIARRDTLLFPDDLMPAVPTPSPDLIDKTQGGHDHLLFKTLGFRYYHQLRQAMARYRDPRSVRRLMDLGCGSGR